MFLQVIITLFVIFVLGEIILSFRKKELSRLTFIFWSFVWIAILIVVWFAGLTFYVARLLNIHRGIDSVVYISIVILFYLAFRMLLKMEKIERKIEEIVRSHTLRNSSH